MKDTWESDIYDDKFEYVSRYGLELVELLKPLKNELVLDIGCGTGDISNQVFLRGAKCIGLDISENMISKAKIKYPEIEFIVKDAVEMNYDEKFDGIISNAALHWIKQPQIVIEAIFRALKKQGRFIAEFGGKGNVDCITKAICEILAKYGCFDEVNSNWYFPGLGECCQLLEEKGFEIISAKMFDRLTCIECGMKDWLMMFAGSIFKMLSADERKDVLNEVETRLKSSLFHNGMWYIDYKRLRINAVKK
jgi:ubiquinone/menaquinone biosynthesis C-methylase UbiE